jgi:hypothetical protein
MFLAFTSAALIAAAFAQLGALTVKVSLLSLTFAAQHAGDDDLPAELLPLTISNAAAKLAGIDSDRVGGVAWD